MKRVLSIFLILTVIISNAQEKKRIKLIKAKDLLSSKAKYNNAQRIIGDVTLKHEDVFLDCDSAHLDKKNNTAIVFDNVHIKKADSIDIYADYGEMLGNIKLLKLRNNVVIKKKSGETLYTDNLDYDLKKDIASYFKGGKLIKEKDTIISKKAFLYTKKDSIELIDDVEIYGEKHTVFSDYINYNFKKEFVNFKTPTEIFYDGSYLYSEKGWYNSKNKTSELLKNNRVIHDERIIDADTIFADGVDSTVLALSNVVINDTVNKMILKSDYSFFDNKSMKSLTTDNVLGIAYNDIKDSLFFTCDTIKTFYDSTQTYNNIVAYHNIKIYKSNMQGNCDSLRYSFKDSTIFLYNRPVLWFENNQVMANTIKLYQKAEELDSVELNDKAYIFTKKNEFDYNQVKGKDIYINLEEGHISYADVVENAESIYYLQQKTGRIVGLNRATSKEMFVEFKNGKLFSIDIKDNAKSNINPIKLVTEDKSKLKEFEWLDHLRPKDKYFNMKPVNGSVVEKIKTEIKKIK
jgi:lipopolysaccharide export system protein LptA